jgi:hypothetical protein
MDAAYIRIGGKKIRAEVAKSFWQKARGLMFREGLAGDEGMLFVFSGRGVLRFWMMLMKFPIDIVFLDEKGSVIKIHHYAEPSMNPFRLYSSGKKAKYALEVRGGLCKKRGVKRGVRIRVV